MYPLAKEHQKNTAQFYIGAVAEITGATRKAIRHYESLGLLPKATRKGNYRVYCEQDLFLIHLIKQGQRIGFTLSELKPLLAEQVDTKVFPMAMANQLMDAKRQEFQCSIKKLECLKTELNEMQIEMTAFFDTE